MNDNKLGLQAVPDVPTSPDELGDLVPADELLAEEEVNIEELFGVLESQNAELVNRLHILGKGINPLMLLKIQLDTLIDFTFDDESRKNFETACSMRLNETLKTTIAQLLGASVDG